MQHVTKQQLIVAVLATAVVFGGAGFFGGAKFAQSKGRRGGFAQEAGGMRVQFGAGAAGSRAAAAAGFASGEIIAKDETTITVKLRDGGSRIVLLSDATAILKSDKGTRDDLAVGAQVIVNGKPNAEGSMTAETISLPGEGALMPMFLGGGRGAQGRQAPTGTPQPQ